MEQKKTSKMSIFLLLVFSVVFLIPFMIMVAGSLITSKVPMGNPFTWIFDKDMSLANFVYIIKNSQYIKWFFNSFSGIFNRFLRTILEPT